MEKLEELLEMVKSFRDLECGDCGTCKLRDGRSDMYNESYCNLLLAVSDYLCDIE